jgi:hypothetical protein
MYLQGLRKTTKHVIQAAEIWTEYLSNTSLELYRYASPLDDAVPVAEVAGSVSHNAELERVWEDSTVVNFGIVQGESEEKRRNAVIVIPYLPGEIRSLNFVWTNCPI